jgi:putative ABC transport system substrate-binding protein
MADARSVVAGTVTDARGVAVEGAVVTLTSVRGGSSRLRTDAFGAFRFPSQAAWSTYALSVDAPGFRTVAYEGFRLEAGRARRFEIRLKRPGDREVLVLLSRDPYPFDDLLRGLLRGLDVPVHVVDLDREENPEEAVRRLRDERPNLVLGAGLLAARLVRREVHDIPAILTLISDPRRYDLEAVNVSFVATNPPPEDLIRRIRDFVPGARRLGLVYDAQASTLVARDIGRAARRAGLTILSRPCYTPRSLESTLNGLAGRIDVLAVPFDPVTVGPEALDMVTGWALRHRVPLAAPGPEWVRRGALFSYGATPETIGRDLSYLAREMLFQGRQPSDLRFRPPTAPFLALNETTAIALGITVPPGLAIDATY